MFGEWKRNKRFPTSANPPSIQNRSEKVWKPAKKCLFVVTAVGTMKRLLPVSEEGVFARTPVAHTLKLLRLQFQHKETSCQLRGNEELRFVTNMLWASDWKPVLNISPSNIHLRVQQACKTLRWQMRNTVKLSNVCIIKVHFQNVFWYACFVQKKQTLATICLRL